MEINFSKKPCKNKKEKLFGIYLPIGLIILLSLVNLLFYMVFYSKNTDAHNKINSLKQKTEIANKNANIAVNKLSKINYKSFVKEYNFLNSILGKSNLKWSKLFNQLEEILPYSVKIIVISPNTKYNETRLNITAEAVDKDSQLKFIENIFNNKSFKKPTIENESIDSVTNNLKFSMSVIYIGDSKWLG